MGAIEVWVPCEGDGWFGHQMVIGGYVVQITTAPGGQQPGMRKGGQQVGTSAFWWRIDDGEWKPSGERSMIGTRRKLPEFVENLIAWGVLPPKEP